MLLIEVSVLGWSSPSERLAEVAKSLFELAHRTEQPAHAVDRVQRLRVVVAQLGPAGPQRGFLQGHRRRIATDVAVCSRHGLLKRRADQRLVGEVRLDRRAGDGESSAPGAGKLPGAFSICLTLTGLVGTRYRRIQGVEGSRIQGAKDLRGQVRGRR